MKKYLEQAIDVIKKKYLGYHVLDRRAFQNDSNYALVFCPDEPDGVDRDETYLFINNLLVTVS